MNSYDVDKTSERPFSQDLWSAARDTPDGWRNEPKLGETCRTVEALNRVVPADRIR